MVAAAGAAAAGGAGAAGGTSALINALGIAGALGDAGVPSLKTSLGNWQDAQIAKAYQSYLNGVIGNMGNALEARADKYDNKLQAMSNEAEPQYMQEANTQLAEVGQLVKDISDEAAEAQRQNRRQVQAELAQQGVRGGQAAILANRATGELNRNLQRDINQTVYDEALNRQNSRLGYLSQKAITPWTQRANAYSSSLTGANNALSNAQGNE